MPSAVNDSTSSTSSSGSSSADGDSIKLMIRVRPPVSYGEGAALDHATCLDVDVARHAVVMKSRPEPKVFTFDEVSDHNTTQEEVFSSIGKKIIDGCINGYNGTIFAYGQTGSGKTFTMMGPHEDSDCFQNELRGIIPRSFEYLFKLIKKECEINGEKMTFLCKCSFLEIYNEQIYDLLDPAGTPLSLHESIKLGVYVEGLKELVVSSPMEAYNVLTRGWTNRTVAETSMNRESSRSHAVFTFKIESKVKKGGVWNIKMSRLHLVDLAGSERQKDTNTTGQRLKEAGNINKSLSVLGNVIMALVDVAQGKTRHVPYRDSKLSFLLRDSLGGNSKTCIVACIHPGSKCFGETLSTLQFARRAKMIKNKAVVNEDLQGSVTHLQAEIKRLKDENNELRRNSGGIVLPSSADSDNCLDNAYLPDDANHSQKYRQLFLKAMRLYMRSEADKQVSAGKSQRLLETIERKDQAIRQSKMVIKFREDALRKYERAAKECTDLTPDEKDAVIECLRSETRSLQAIIDHHPELTRCQSEAEALKVENSQLRDQFCSRYGDPGKEAAELENILLQLLEEQDADSGEASNGFRHPQKDNNMETTAASNAMTVAKQAEISSLHEAMEALKRECSETVERMTREQINDKAELVSLQTAKTELERLLQAQKIRTQVERETREDLHSKTIKIITTPKKSVPLHLVTSPLYSGGAGSGVSPLNLDVSGVSEGIIGEGPPAQMNEEHIDGLTQEISHLQEELRKVKALLEKADSCSVTSVQENSRLNEQNKRLNELFEEAKCKWETTRVELERANRKLTDENSTLVDNNKLILSELHDLRVISISTDRRLTELTAESKTSKAAFDKELQQLGARLRKLGMEHSTLEADLEMRTEERDQLREREDTLQATLDFNADQLSAAEQRLESLEATNKFLDDKIVMLTTHLEELKREKERSLQELHQESGAIESRLFEALTLVDTQRADLHTKTAEMKTKDEIITSLELKLSETKLDIERLTKSEAKREEVLASLTSRVTELKDELSHILMERDNATTELEELRERITVVQNQCCTLEAKISAQTTLHQEIVSKLQQTINSRDLEYGMLREDFEHLSGQLEAELQQATLAAEKNKDLELDVTGLRTDNAVLQSSVIEWQTRSEAQAQQLDLLKSELVTYKLDLEEALCKLEQERTANANNRAVIDALEQDQKQQHDELLKRESCLNEMIQLHETATKNSKDNQESARLASIEVEEYSSRFDAVSKENEYMNVQLTTLNEENCNLKEKIKKLEADYLFQLNENSKLSGHHNQGQKILYVEKLKNDLLVQRQELDVKNVQLSSALAQLAACRCNRLPSTTSLG